VVGNVSMDQLTVDLGPDGTAFNGDEVVLIGSQENEVITVKDVAEWGETIEHEVIAILNTRIPRRYFT
jgi:alanine racemase